jgi:hypothetical protein
LQDSISNILFSHVFLFLSKSKQVIKKAILFSLVVINFALNAQSNPRSIYKNGFGIQLGGPTSLFSVSYNHFWTANINGEVGVGILGAYTGAKYYFDKEYKKQLAAPYVGATIAIIPPFFSKGFQRVIYVPFGIQLISKKGFHFSLEIAPIFIKDYGEMPGLMNDVTLFGGLKIGKNFR